MAARGAPAETAERILDLAEALVATRGYSAFSYQDIADELHITKASIHYHFAAKADLGVAVVERYSRRFGEALEAVLASGTMTSREMLGAYCRQFLEVSRAPDRVCLCGALAGELPALPENVRKAVARFFRDQRVWIERVLMLGAERGELRLPAPADKVARLLFAALQGALLVKRATGDASDVEDVIAIIEAEIS